MVRVENVWGRHVRCGGCVVRLQCGWCSRCVKECGYRQLAYMIQVYDVECCFHIKFFSWFFSMRQLKTCSWCFTVFISASLGLSTLAMKDS